MRSANRMRPQFGHHVRHLRDAEHVQDQRHFAIAHDGGPGKAGQPLQLLAQRLYDNFLGVVDLVHHQAELAVVGLQHHDIDDLRALPSVAEAGRRSSRLRSTRRKQVAAKPIDRGPPDILDAGDGVGPFQANQLQQADLRDSEAFLHRW